MENVIWRRANKADLYQIEKIIDDSSNLLKERKIDQWQGSHKPSSEILLNDIKNNFGYVLELDDEIIAFTSLCCEKHQIYDQISVDKFIINKNNYITIHRFCTKQKQELKGIGNLLMKNIVEYVNKSLVIDVRIFTHPKNEIMKHLICKYGFIQIEEIIDKRLNSPRLVFQLK